MHRSPPGTARCASTNGWFPCWNAKRSRTHSANLGVLESYHGHLAELFQFPAAALVIEAQYGDFGNPARTRPMASTRYLRALAHIDARHPNPLSGAQGKFLGYLPTRLLPELRVVSPSGEAPPLSFFMNSPKAGPISLKSGCLRSSSITSPKSLSPTASAVAAFGAKSPAHVGARRSR